MMMMMQMMVVIRLAITVIRHERGIYRQSSAVALLLVSHFLFSVFIFLKMKILKIFFL
jgi:hypothetical protein